MQESDITSTVFGLSYFLRRCLLVIQVINIPRFSFLGKERLPLNQLSTIEKAMFSCYPNPLAMVEGSGLGI